MKKKPGPVVYTNIALGAEQHRILKHLAVEEKRGLADLVREAVAGYLAARKKTAQARYEDDFLWKIGRTWHAKVERPYKPEDWSEIDRVVYGLDEDFEKK